MDTKSEDGGNLSNSEMGPSTGQTHLDTSMVVSLVSEEPEELAPEMAQWGQWKALQAFSRSRTAAQTHKEKLLKGLDFY